MKKSDELKVYLNKAKQEMEVINANPEASLEDVNNKMAEIKTLKAKLESQLEIENEELADVENVAKPVEVVEADAIDDGFTPANAVKGYKKAFMNAVKGVATPEQSKMVKSVRNALEEGVPANGGLIVPQDIQTKINEYRESRSNMSQWVNVVKVNTLNGSRIFKVRTTQTGFAKVLENGTIPTKATPTFEEKKYAVEKYAGLLYSSNELLADTDQDIEATLVEWIGNESRVTRNNIIKTALDLKAKTAIATLDDVKTALNVTLNPAFRDNAVILTNQSGFNWLDQQKTAVGGYYQMQPDVTSPTGFSFAGVPVAFVSNDDFPNVVGANTLAPFVIGDLKSYMTIFDRQALQISKSTEAATAYETDRTVWKAVERLDDLVIDDTSIVYGQIKIV